MEAIAWWWGLAWAIPFAALVRLARRTPDVTSHPPLGDVPVSIIIPARNEAATIENVIRSVLASHHRPLQLIVVDDRSTDDTRARALAAARGDPRCRVLAGAELPPGWFGKPWACHQGAREATGEILVFTDADTTHHPDLIGHTVGAIRSEGLDLLTLTSRQLCLTFWERLVMPQIWALLGWRYPPIAVNRATRPHQVVANGQFIAVPRDVYVALGGHEAVRGEVVEDLALAQRFLLAGKRLRMMHGERLLSTRMYRSLPELVEGWSKNLYLGARQSLRGFPLLARLAPLGLVAGFVFWLLPPVVLALGVATAPALVAIAISLVFWVAISTSMQIPAQYAIGYPLGAAMALWIALRSTLRGATRVEWRGRVYDTRQ